MVSKCYLHMHFHEYSLNITTRNNTHSILYIFNTDTHESSVDLNYLPPLPLSSQFFNDDVRRDRRSRNSLIHKITSTGNASDVWPPASRDNWIKVMVVADGPMLKYHGDKLERYILTLMQTVC